MARRQRRRHAELIALDRAARKLHALDHGRFMRVLALTEAFVSVCESDPTPDGSNPDLDVDALVAAIVPPRGTKASA